MSRTTKKFASDVRERVVRLVLDHESNHPSRWAAVSSIVERIGCSAHTLLEWMKMAEVISDKRASVPTELADRLMPEHMARANAASSAIRATVELIFAHQKKRYGLFIRTIGIDSAQAKLTLANLVYNFDRLIFHQRFATTV